VPGLPQTDGSVLAVGGRSNVFIGQLRPQQCLVLPLASDRLAMIRYGIPELRMFFDPDLRILRQFR
jgi:hypothetical protein